MKIDYSNFNITLNTSSTLQTSMFQAARNKCSNNGKVGLSTTNVITF